MKCLTNVVINQYDSPKVIDDFSLECKNRLHWMYVMDLYTKNINTYMNSYLNFYKVNYKITLKKIFEIFNDEAPEKILLH